MEVAVVLTNKQELKNGALMNGFAAVLGIVFLLMIASLRYDVLKVAEAAEEAERARVEAEAAERQLARERGGKVALVAGSTVWAERLKAAGATANRRRMAMRASARAAAAAAGAARHATWRAARANGAAWPTAAAAARAAVVVAQRAAHGAMKSVRDAELAVSVSSSVAMRLHSQAGDGRTRLGDVVAMKAAQEARRLNKLPCGERVTELAGVQQSWLATFGGKLEPRARARAGWQPRAVLPALRPGSAYVHDI
jgi:hypothetical protein